MNNHSKIDVDHNSDHVTPAYHLGYADGLAGDHPDDERADYQQGWRDGRDARNAPGGTPAQLRRLADDHRRAALRTRVEQLGLNPAEIVELDLTTGKVKNAKRDRAPKTTLDRSSVGHRRGAA